MRNLIVGVTALLGLAGVFGLLLLFGYVPAWMEGGYELRVLMSDASGLTNGSRVRLSGIDVGRITAVRFREEPGQTGVEIVTLIRDGVLVPSRAVVRAESPLIGGNPTLAFDVGHLDADQLRLWLPVDGSAVVKGESLTLVSQFAGELEAAMAEPTKQFNQIARRFDYLSQEWAVVGENLNRLIGPNTPGDVDTGATVGNLTTVLARADQRLAEAGRVIDGINQWVNNPRMQQDATAAVANARQAMEQLNNALPRLEHRLVALADDMAGAVGTMQAVLSRAQAGEGTVGKLFNDPAVYDNLNDTAQRLGLALDELRLMIQKWKAEGLPVQF